MKAIKQYKFLRTGVRLLLDWKTIKKLPIKYCKDKRPICEAMRGWFFNPIYYYPKYSRKITGECGYDNNYRYVLVTNLKEIKK